MLIKEALPYQPAENREVDVVFFEWYELAKKRMKKTSASGRDIALALERHLHDKDVLWVDAEIIIYVQVQPSRLVEITVGSLAEMGKVCFLLGNRHLPLAIKENSVRVPYDQPTLVYLKKQGFNAVMIEDKFTGYTECHDHAGDHGRHHSHSV